jgi:hypothetical protein
MRSLTTSAIGIPSDPPASIVSRHGANEEPLVRGHGFSRRVLAGLVSASC